MAATIKAMKRDDLRRSKTKELRNQGVVPAVVYGKETQPTTVAVNSMELLKTVRDEGRNSVFSLEVEGGNPVNVMLYDVQEDSLKNEVIHADFYQVDMSREVDVEVTVHLEGQDEIKNEGVVQQTLYQLQVRAKPNEIPDAITVNIGNLEIGDVIEVKDLKGGRNYEILEDDTTTVVTILPPQNVIEEEPEGEAEQQESTDETDSNNEEKEEE
jgi:large subunit ribosomal protein L25